jgi:hypothetical protein
LGTVKSLARTRRNKEEAADVWPPLVSERKKGKRCCCGTGLAHPVARAEKRKQPIPRPRRPRGKAGHRPKGEGEKQVGPGAQEVILYFSFFLSFTYIYIFQNQINKIKQI